MISLWIALLLLSGSRTATADNQSSGKDHREVQGLCSEVLATFVLGVHAHAGLAGLPRVEVRRCAPVGGLQLAAWKAGANAPSLVTEIERFSLGQLLASGNVVAIEAPGPYDAILILQYRRGEPHIAFSDSTHDEIRLRSERNGVVLTLTNAQTRKKTVRRFKVNEHDLVVQQ